MSAVDAFRSLDARKEQLDRSLTRRAKGSNMRGLLQSDRGETSPLSHGDLLDDRGRAHHLYRAIDDTVYASIRPIAVRYAGQPVRVALVPRRRSGFSRVQNGRLLRKHLNEQGLIDRFPDNPRGDRDFKALMEERSRACPLAVKRQLPADAVFLDEHPTISMFEAPNDFMTQFQIMSNVAASMMSAGSAFLLFDRKEESMDTAGQASATMYYVPKTWVEANHSEGPFTKIRVTNQLSLGGQRNSATFGRGEFARLALWDPASPVGALSPALAMADAINSGKSITEAHSAALRNVFSPKYAVTIGRAIDGNAPGSGRALLDAKYREELRERFREMATGMLRAGEPLLLDAFIEDVKRLGELPNELDFLNSQTAIDDKVGRGFGVSKILSGFVQNANRASSAVASELFLDLVVNPLLVLSGQALTQYIAPYYATNRYRLVIYHERAVVNDNAERRARVGLLREYLTPEEARRFMMTGELDIDPDAFDLEEYRERQQIAGGPSGSGTGQGEAD